MARAKRERRSVAQEVTALLTRALEPTPSVSLLELHGFGKELWKDDVASHVKNERDAWR